MQTGPTAVVLEHEGQETGVAVTAYALPAVLFVAPRITDELDEQMWIGPKRVVELVARESERFGYRLASRAPPPPMRRSSIARSLSTVSVVSLLSTVRVLARSFHCGACVIKHQMISTDVRASRGV